MFVIDEGDDIQIKHIDSGTKSRENACGLVFGSFGIANVSRNSLCELVGGLS